MKNVKIVLYVLLLLVAAKARAQVLYKIEGNGLEVPSYIFGTNHVAPLSVIDDFGAAEVFDLCTRVVGEIDMTQGQMEIAAAMQPYMIAPPDSALSKVLSAQEYAMASEQFKKNAPMPGMELKMLESFKPMVVQNIVSVSILTKLMPGFNPEQQLDKYFQVKGKEQGKSIIALETVEQQSRMLFGFMPIALQAESLVEFLSDTSKACDDARELAAAYMAGDLERMEALSHHEETHPEFMDMIVDRRNEAWLAEIPAIISEAPTFIAVGALHLAGEKGVLEGLRRLGYTVTPLPSK